MFFHVSLLLHTFSCIQYTLPELPDVGSSRPDPVLATGTTETPLTWPRPGCHSLDEEMSLYI